MLLDGETFDLVQHIDTVLAAVAGHELEPRINSELMQSVLEVATPVCHTPAGVQQQLLRIRRYVTDVAREKGLRVGSAGTHPFSLFEAQRITAKDRYRATRRPDAVHRATGADLRDARPRRGRRPGEGDPGRERADRAPRRARRAVGELAVLARRADRAPLLAPHGLRRLPALGPAAPLPRLRRLRAGREPAREDRLHPGLHPHLVGHPPPPAARHGRDPDLRRGDAARGRDRDHGVLPGARQALRGARRARRGDPVLPPHPHDREQVARRALRALGAGDGPPHRTPQPAAGGSARAADAEDAARRTRATSARRRSSRASTRSCAAATAPTGSCTSSTRTGTSSRWRGRSPTRRRSRRSPSRRPPHRLGRMLEIGEKAPLEAVVWTTPRERARIGDLLHDRPLLLLFYLFDWSST